MSPSSEARVVEHVLRLTADLHARPAGQLAQAAARFAAVVTVSVAGRQANARSVLAVMGLGATAGSDVTLTADGADAEAALDALAEILRIAE